EHENLRIVRVPEGVEGFARAMAEIILIHVLAESMAANAGIVIEDFLYSQTDTKLKKDA
ncbi:MAG: hypothetical protein JWQ68_2075, partial [Cryobacterium sp.]|nr:hypothetical protein [Cryobacterium sp.]